jgi:SpoVK/Ycf46/Vps4 family AAA+-type ATPase
LGTTARNIGALFQFANRYQCLLLLDEFDALAKLRDDPQEVGEIKRVVNTLLQNIDKRAAHGFTMAITNHEALLDPAVWRRFEVRIVVPVPEYAERRKILELYLQPLPVDGSALIFLAWLSQGLTGSDLESMARSIKRFITIHGRGDFALMEALRAYALTNATAQRTEILELLLASPQEIARRILSEPDLGLTQHDVGKLLGKDQATISRWVRNDLTAADKAAIHAE